MDIILMVDCSDLVLSVVSVVLSASMMFDEIGMNL